MIDRPDVRLFRPIKGGLLFVFCLLAVFPGFGKQQGRGTDYMLVVSVYAEASAWSNDIIIPVINMAAGIENLNVYSEYMNMLLIDNDTLATEFKRRLFANYREHPPRMLLLIGNPAKILLEDVKKHWGDIPILFCADKEYVGTDSLYLKRNPIPPDLRTPLSELVSEYNLTVLQTPVFLRQSVDLMRRMIPGMKELVFLGDDLYINRQDEQELSELMRTDYPELSYRYFSAADMTTGQLFDSLKTIDRKTTGVLYSSWWYKKNFVGNTVLMTNAYRGITTFALPFFSLHPSGIRDSNGIVGGFVYSQEAFNKKLIETISGVLAGRQPRDIPFYFPRGIPTFNYESLVGNGFSLADTPKGAVVYNRPPSFFEQYKYVLFGTVVLFVVALLLFQSKRNRMLQKLSKAQLREIQIGENYTNLFDNMPIIYMQERVVLDESGDPVDTVFCDVNRSFERSFYPKERIIGKKGSEIFPESMPEFLHFIRIAIAERRSITFTYYFKSIDTFYEVVLCCSHMPGIIDVFCLDSTQLHDVQQKLSTTNKKLSMALEIASIVPWKWNLRERTILCDVNRPIELGGLDGDVREEQLSVPDTQYFAKIRREDRERVRCAYRDLAEGRVAKVKEEYRVIVGEGRGRRQEWVEAQAAVETWDGSGKPLVLVRSSQVITERKKMEQELMSAKDRAEESNRLKSAFLANMSHEIRTPLNAIVGFSGILALSDSEQEKQEYVGIIENNNALLLQLIGDILDLSKIEAGTLEFVYSDFDLNELMQEKERVMRMRLKTDRVELAFERPLAECPIRSERNRLSQLLINLISNAIKFTKQGSIRFGYELRGQEIYCYVTDTGCGIPQDKKDSVFGRFVKLNHFEQGTGLGLSICHTIVRHMGGRIGVESEEGKGSTFWFTIPYTPATLRPEDEPEERPLVAVEKDKLTVLIAEDDDSNYRLFETILRHDYRLVHAWNGKEAVELFEQYRPHLVLMDLNMPVMDGYEATREIRKISSDVPVLAVTAFAFASDEQKVMQNGFDGYMPKPINAKQLKGQILDMLQSRMTLI